MEDNYNANYSFGRYKNDDKVYARYMQDICKLYASYMQAICWLYVNYMQEIARLGYGEVESSHSQRRASTLCYQYVTFT